uniref:ATP synthase complex subunit 8 n=1 Tax=Corethrella condita TaxID=2527952 RepID=A0A411NHI8_9DIPT|nr:ATP synthase F0 subunit 8 [Corethrella condita]
MPQMAPISWLILFIIFSITLIVFNILNYYSFLPTSSTKTQGKIIDNISMTWKW